MDNKSLPKSTRKANLNSVSWCSTFAISRFEPKIFGCFLLLNSMVSAGDKPNIIFIEVDDLTYTYVSPWGSKIARTPNLDRLSREGFVFDNAVCQGMMCGPSRNSLISGKYPHQLGFYENGDLRKLPQEIWTLPKVLKKNGYTTAWIGKSHLKPFFQNKKEKEDPATFRNYFGFDYALHTLGRGLVGDRDDDEDLGKGDTGNTNPYLKHLAEKGLLEKYQADNQAKRNSTLPEDDYLDGWFTKNTEDYLAGCNTDQPLFLWINYSVPHDPYDVADSYHEPFRELSMPGITRPKNFTTPPSLVRRTKSYKNSKLAEEDQRGFYANIYFMDCQVGRILEALKKKNMLENSWIVFFSDQGVMKGALNLQHKSTLFRQVTQPCMIIRPPLGKFTSGRISAPVELMDLLPTFLEVAQITNDSPQAGESMMPLFQGGKMKRRYAFGEIENWVMVTDGHYRLIRSLQGEPSLLFDDLKDPENLYDLSGEKPELIKELSDVQDEWVRQTGPRQYPLKAKKD
jgi:arylsulfatase A-like enzyme